MMFLSLIAAAALGLPQPEVWRKLEPPQLDTGRVGGGQSWINPPGVQPCRQEHFTCAAIAFRQGDTATTIAELEMAVGDGDARAMRALGLMLRSGIGVPADPQLGEYWLQRAAEQR
jgi:TPR repeat protein